MNEKYMCTIFPFITEEYMNDNITPENKICPYIRNQNDANVD